jgi:hypothetical protein
LCRQPERRQRSSLCIFDSSWTRKLPSTFQIRTGQLLSNFIIIIQHFQNDIWHFSRYFRGFFNKTF